MSEERRRILPLDKTVVNLIAAGEIIIAPSNAIKELLENSIDAKSTHIEILVKDGGLKLLQITDNGVGINKDDLPILCERFTTSKLVEFDDLKEIGTYGFRGEALASISHVSRLSVITKTSHDSNAWRASYLNGDLVDDVITPIAGKDGTVLTVEDLFYNVPSRLRALKSVNEEYLKIVDVVNKYSIHVEDIGFTCQRQGGKGYDVMIRKTATRKDRIRSIYGSGVSSHLMEVTITPSEQFKMDFGLNKCVGCITNTSFENKKSIQPIFFINNRLVVCEPLKRAISSVYSSYLPKGHKPFVFLSLEISPQNVDVNVHPTKREVRFLNEDEIIEEIVVYIDKMLSELDSSRNFLTQQILTNTRKIEDDIEGRRSKRSKLSTDDQPLKIKEVLRPMIPLSQFKKPYEHEMVRSDYSQMNLNNYVKYTPSKSTANTNSDLAEVIAHATASSQSSISETANNFDEENAEANSSVILETSEVKKKRQPMELLSIKELRQELQERGNNQLTQLFSQHSYVGIADYRKRLCCLQHEVKLYLVDYASLCNELFYQIGLADFGNFGRIEIVNADGIDIKSLLETEILGNSEFIELFKSKNGLTSLPDIDEMIQTCFVEMYEMWEEYFSIELDVSNIQRPKLKSVPLLIKGYIPSWNKLSLFLFRVITKIDWNDEKKCLGGILRQLALFFIPDSIDEEPLSPTNEPIGKVFESEKKQVSHCIENIIMPLVKQKFLATDNLSRDIIEIASVPKLYKVFERC